MNQDPSARCTIFGLGEILWDLFPGGEKSRKLLGGAPANVAFHVTRLGDAGGIVARVGNDTLGAEAIAALDASQVDTRLVEVDHQRQTGVARVTEGMGGPTFAIDGETAWSYVACEPATISALATCDALCFGTMLASFERGRAVQRQAVAALPARALKVLDVNLRPPFVSESGIVAALELANVVKLNEQELVELAPLGGTSVDPCVGLMERFAIDVVALTCGADGSVLLRYTGASPGAGARNSSRLERAEHPGFPATGGTVDPVGAGDAFTAVLIHQLLRNAPLAVINERANHYAARVASVPGAMPTIDNPI